MGNEKLRKQIDFIVEIDKMKNIFRQTSLIDKSRRENDAEHSWHIAIMAMILSKYADKDIDECKVIKMLLVHDLIEIYAGDTFCYDEIGNLDKKERENNAADKLFSMLPEEEGQEIRELWEEFEEMGTENAIFAASMDRLQPMLQNYFSDDGGTWKKFNISKEQVYERISPVKKASKELWKFVEYMVEDSYEKGYIPREK